MRFLTLILAFFIWSHSAIAQTNFADRPDVKNFISEMVNKYHFNHSELVAIFNSVQIRPDVIRSIRHPYEQKPWYNYQTLFVTEWRAQQGVKFWEKYHTALERAEREYGVPASIIVATIGVETKYGYKTGDFRVIDTLSTLSFVETSRARFFRNELKEFLLMSREQHKDPLKMMGSYAGAMGQPQFMPSSFRHYAVNFSGSGTIDLSYNTVDVIGSIANYYQKHGWQKDQPIAVKSNLVRHHIEYTTNSYIDPMDDKMRSLYKQKSKLIELQGYHGREYWLGFHNFDVIKTYNPSDLYAMAVYQLSHDIFTLKGKTDNA